ncbi:MAG: acyltransferase family protein [Chloroflexota bacterium]
MPDVKPAPKTRAKKEKAEAIAEPGSLSTKPLKERANRAVKSGVITGVDTVAPASKSTRSRGKKVIADDGMTPVAPKAKRKNSSRKAKELVAATTLTLAAPPAMLLLAAPAPIVMEPMVAPVVVEEEKRIDPASAVRSGALKYIPAIDGLRALAVTAVLLYHSALGWLPGGFLGVEVFFVISGYLITSLLIADRAKHGNVSLLSFWKRRARRLLPAAFMLIIATLVYSVVFLPDEVAALRGNALAAFGYVSNWYQIFHSQSYFESLGRPSLLKHLWSLGVEEQFYLVWPIVFTLVLARLRRRYAFGLIVAGAMASAALMWYKFDPAGDPSRIYYGTDTRASGLLIGAALAFAWQAGGLTAKANRFLRWTPDVCGIVALAALTAIALVIHETDAVLYRGGFAIVGLATAVLIAAAVHPDARILRRVLGQRPLLWLGTRSYSIYLWHWPVFMLTRPGQDIALGAVPAFALRLAITFVVAELSYRLVEMPVRRGALGRMRQSLRQSVGQLRRPTLQAWKYRPLAATGFAGVGVLFLGFTVAAAGPPTTPSYLAVGEVHTYSWSQATESSTPTPEPTPFRILATATPSELTSVLPRAHVTASATPTPIPVTNTASPPPTSVATTPPLSATPPVVTSSPPPPLASPPSRVLALGDSVMLGAAPEMAAAIPNLEIDAAVSRQVAAGIDLLAARRDAGTLGDVVIIHLGTNGTFTPAQFDQIMDILSGVQRVVFVNLKVPRDWEDSDNSVIADGVARYPNAVLADWFTVAKAHPEFFYEDDIHLKPDGANFYAQMIASDSQ